MTTKSNYKPERNILSKTLDAQIERFVGVLQAHNRKFPHPRPKKNYPFLSYFFKNFVADQNARALEISLPSYEKIKKLANQQFPVRTLWNLCIDGRVLSILAHGATAGVGSGVRVPGGMLREFVRGKDGKLFLAPDSDFAILLKRALQESKKNVLAEVFDSHIGCAARLAEEQLKGKDPLDDGLFADVSHKMQMAQASIAFAKHVFGDEKNLIVILTSFDPHSGFLYMGLETNEALIYTLNRGNNAYTQEILDRLTNFGKIISTEQLASEEEIEKIFSKYRFNLEWKTKYVKSATLFWEAIASMKKAVFPIIHKKLHRAYPHLTKNNTLAEIELEERSMLLLTNAFSGYLHNVEGKGGGEGIHKHYPYGIHNEEGIKVSEGGYPPYDISMFTVFSFEEKNLPTSIQLAVALVRDNRKKVRIVDGSLTFTEVVEFTQASVPIVVSEIVRDFLSEREWEKLSAIDWKDMPETWDIMTDDEFYMYLHNKDIRQFNVALAINNLRRKMMVMYDMHSPISSRIIEQYSVALPIIVSRNRKVRFIVPFVKLGFS